MFRMKPCPLAAVFCDAGASEAAARIPPFSNTNRQFTIYSDHKILFSDCRPDAPAADDKASH